MATDLLFRGVAPALVTPFTADDDIDVEAFRALIERQIEGGASGLVVLGGAVAGFAAVPRFAVVAFGKATSKVLDYSLFRAAKEILYIRERLNEIIARHTRRRFRALNAASAGVKELRSVLDEARDRLAADGQRTILFIDELHRFSRTQQDVLLPDVESGVVSLIGATTANPFFSLVSPLVSRSQVFEFRPLEKDDVLCLLRRALDDEREGLGTAGVDVEQEALDFLAEVSDGDARRALNGLEIAVLSAVESGGAVNLDVAQESIQ